MPRFILGSGSKSRLALLRQAGFEPDLVVSSDIDETPLKKEKPKDYVERVARTKAEKLHETYFGDVILCADTTISSSRHGIVQKCFTDEEIRKSMEECSGRSIQVLTAVCMINADNKMCQKTIETSIKFKHLNPIDIDDYVASKEGVGCASGIKIEGVLESFIIKIVGNYSSIMGLPLYHTRNMLISAGIKTKIIGK